MVPSCLPICSLCELLCSRFVVCTVASWMRNEANCSDGLGRILVTSASHRSSKYRPSRRFVPGSSHSFQQSFSLILLAYSVQQYSLDIDMGRQLYFTITNGTRRRRSTIRNSINENCVFKTNKMTFYCSAAFLLFLFFLLFFFIGLCVTSIPHPYASLRIFRISSSSTFFSEGYAARSIVSPVMRSVPAGTKRTVNL